MTGSSPRLRGTRRGVLADERSPRFIPAFAGNARDRIVPGRGVSVHPRVCGERRARAPVTPSMFGSSPRLRGTRDLVNAQGKHVRFIPAFAGNALRKRSPRPAGTVHPRVCGERFQASTASATVAGSSPRLRGTHLPPWAWALGCRFIPAFAGNAQPPGACPGARTVHPRVCGERLSQLLRTMMMTGSSPRLRGTQHNQ